MKNLKYLLCVLSLIIYGKLNGQSWIDYGYETRSLGSSYQEIICSGNASTSGSSFKLNVFSTQSTPPLQINKVYKLIDDNDNVKYLYIISLKSQPWSDRDSYNANNLEMPNILCDKGYFTRELGNSYQHIVCYGDPANSGGEYALNILTPVSGATLAINKVYKFTDNADQIHYLYVTGLRDMPWSDRDSYDRSKLISPYISCDVGLAARDLGSSLSTAKSLMCSGEVEKKGLSYDLNISPAGSYYIQPGNLYKFINNDNDIRYLYIVSKGSPFTDRDTYLYNSLVKQSVYCDNDNDGIENEFDDCPNEAGPESNNGCPFKPDLVTGGSTTTYNVSEGSTFTVRFIAENRGDELSNSSATAKIRFVWSLDSDVSSDDVIDLSLPGVPIDYNPDGGESETHDAQIIAPSLSEFNLSTTNNLYLLIFIDYPNEYEESNENNNVYDEILITVNKSSSSGRVSSYDIDKASELSLFPNPVSFMSPLTLTLPNNEMYLIKIFDLHGETVNKWEVENQNQLIINPDLERGVYIIEITGKNESIRKKIIVE